MCHHDHGRTASADRLRLSQATELHMTEIAEPDIITEALAIIDRALAEMTSRQLVSTVEVSDLLLDVRSLLSHPTPT
jgi:hypothetical protein